MSRVPGLDRSELVEFEEGLELLEQVMGFVPNSVMTMARVPGLVPAFQGLGVATLYNGLISIELAQMVALMASMASGCRYCQAHTGHSAERVGVDPDKLEAIWEFETSDYFDEAERAALRLAFHAGQVPNVASDADFAACRKHFSDDQVAAIVGVCAFFGFLNRWNDTMATKLEDSPKEFAARVLTTGGWEVGKHHE